MRRKNYTFVEIDLLFLEQEDIITASAGGFDSEKDNDATSGGDDIFD